MAHELHQERIQVERLAERAILVACHLPETKVDPRDPLGELNDLARTAGAKVVGELIQKRNKPDAGTYLGKGKLAELRAMKEELDATLIVFDNDLSPSQIRNIEKELDCKIIDRSELILDIFAGRATTHAAKLQVELAQLEYTYPRLRAMWSHFGQIAGGAPVGIGTRGPGETQIETDRRLVQRRKTILKKRIEEIQARRVREVANRSSESFTVCLVGYTNAGKSTLFNALTAPSGGGGAYADDRLFATLTTRTRRWPLSEKIDGPPSSNGKNSGGSSSSPSGDDVMLSDTVGFVRDLPHHLVASFRATLEEAIHADVQLVVIDLADPMAETHCEVVLDTLDSLIEERHAAKPKKRKSPFLWKQRSDNEEDKRTDGDPPLNAVALNNRDPFIGGTDSDDENGDDDQPQRIIVLNKIDCLDDQSELAIWARTHPHAIPVSAKTGEGLDQLREAVRLLHVGPRIEYELKVPYSNAKAVSYAEERGEVRDRQFDDTSVIMRVVLGSLHVEHLRRLGAEMRVVT